MGTQQRPSPTFNGSIKIESRPEHLSSDAGVLPLREAMERIGILSWLADRISDPREPGKISHPLKELLAITFFLSSQGWRDQDDADTLRDDPAFRTGSSEQRGVAPLVGEPKEAGDEGETKEPKGLASQPTISRLVEILSSIYNRGVLRKGLFVIAARRIRSMRGHRYSHITVDVDSFPIEVSGRQKGSEYNGHYHARIFHPLVATLGETGDLLDVRLRSGNAYTSDGSLEFIEPLLDEIEREIAVVAAVRIDAGFPCEKFCFGLEERGTDYVARIKNNPVLDRLAVPYLDRHVVGSVEPSLEEEKGEWEPWETKTWLHEETYQAKSWSKGRRVVLVVQMRPGELYPHHFWLLTSWSSQSVPALSVLQNYRRRGCAEGTIGEFMDVLKPALSSSNRSKSHYRDQEPKSRKEPRDSFAANEVLLLLNAIAYNLMHVLRTLMEKGTKEGWSLKRVREQVLKVAARFLVHARNITVVIARSAAKHWTTLWQQLQKLRQPRPLPGYT